MTGYLSKSQTIALAERIKAEGRKLSQTEIAALADKLFAAPGPSVSKVVPTAEDEVAAKLVGVDAVELARRKGQGLR